MATALGIPDRGVEVRATKLLINNRWVDSASGKTLETIDPTTGRVITNVAEADAPDVDMAVKAARAAFTSGKWPKTSAAERGRLLYRLADLIEEHMDELARWKRSTTASR